MSEAAAGQHHGPKHSYHLVDPSPWPLCGSLAAGLMFGGAVIGMHHHTFAGISGWGLCSAGLHLPGQC